MNKPKRPRRSPERQIQAAIVRFLRLALPADAWVGAIPGGDGRATRTPGYVAGTPDLLIVWQGAAHFIEVKSATGRLADMQWDQCAKLIGCEALAEVARSVDDAERICRRWGIPLRATTGPGAAVKRAA